mgnify:CR=1 FL=1|jgi:hypothetical protein
MKIVSAIEDDITIHKTLSHLGLLYPPNRSPPPVITCLRLPVPLARQTGATHRQATPWEKESKSPLTKGDEGGCFSDYIPDIEVYCRDI